MANLHVAFSYCLGGELRTVPADGKCTLCGNTHTPDLRYFDAVLACRNAGTCRKGQDDSLYPSEVLAEIRAASFA